MDALAHPVPMPERRTAQTDGIGSIARRPLVAYFSIAFAISWMLWIPWTLGAEGPAVTALFLLGGFGPLIAAAVVTHATGTPVRAWLRGLWRWRAPGRWYVYALGLPPLVMVAVNAMLVAAGHDIDLAPLGQRLMAYPVSLTSIALVGGGLEEPGWRGFALPRLQATRSPMRATLVLGFLWGVWHIPAYRTPIAFVFPLSLAFLYTLLANRTASVPLCVLLHGGITAAIDQLLFVEDSLAVDVAIFGTFAFVAAVVIALTRGRLGAGATAAPPQFEGVARASADRRRDTAAI
jgi:membrane protease YdiL (CAAX protease family)